MNKYKPLVVLNTVTLAIMLFANFAASTGFFSDTTVASISYKYNTLFAPSGYAFSIWTLIFLLALGFVICQWALFRRNDSRGYIKQTGIWFAMSNLANTLWLYCWINELIGLSVILILILLVSLCILVVKLRMELDDEPALTIFFVWWPIAIYLGWIMVATIACIAAWFVYRGWQPLLIQQDVCTMVMIIIAALLYILLVIKRNLREAALVGIWAFVAIAIRHWGRYNNISIAAIVCSVILFVVISIHAYKNRNSNVISKIRKVGWK